MEFDLENPSPKIDDFHFSPSFFLLESDYMPGDNYSQTLKAKDLDVPVRRQAIASISQLCCNYDPFLSYLAVNYLDRFLATQGMPGDGGLVFEKRTIERMEYIILGALKWRMRSITPFSFLSFFTPLFKLQDHASTEALKARAIQIMLAAQMDIEVLDFKPSVVAASALLAASNELFPLQVPCFEDSISNWSDVDKEKLWKCYGLVQEMAGERYESVVDMPSSSNTPVNVLDMQFSSPESEKTRDAITLESGREIIRRRVNDSPDDRMVQLDQIQRC